MMLRCLLHAGIAALAVPAFAEDACKDLMGSARICFGDIEGRYSVTGVDDEGTEAVILYRAGEFGEEGELAAVRVMLTKIDPEISLGAWSRQVSMAEARDRLLPVESRREGPALVMTYSADFSNRDVFENHLLFERDGMFLAIIGREHRNGGTNDALWAAIDQTAALIRWGQPSE